MSETQKGAQKSCYETKVLRDNCRLIRHHERLPVPQHVVPRVPVRQLQPGLRLLRRRYQDRLQVRHGGHAM